MISSAVAVGRHHGGSGHHGAWIVPVIQVLPGTETTAVQAPMER